MRLVEAVWAAPAQASITGDLVLTMVGRAFLLSRSGCSGRAVGWP